MTFDFLDRRSAERFAEQLDDPSIGHRSVNRSNGEEQLAKLVALSTSLSAARPGVRVDPEFRDGLRAMLVAAAEREGIGRGVDSADNADPINAKPSRTGLAGIFGSGGRRIRTRGAIVIGVAAGAMAVSGISAASESASPGSALYGVKRSTERAQLAIAGSDVTRGQLSLDFARTRLTEAVAMLGDDPEFTRVLNDMDVSTRKGVQLLDTSAVSHRDTKPLTTIDGFVTSQRQTLTPVLDRLTEAGRARAQTSLSLLDDVHRRVDDLRAGLNCATIISTGSDSLGPKLKDCTAPDGAATPARQSGRSDKSAIKAGKEPKVQPEHSGAVGTPKVKAGAKQPNTPTASASAGAVTGGNLAPHARNTPGPNTTGSTTAPPQSNLNDNTDPDSDDGGLGGLLGGIFGH